MTRIARKSDPKLWERIKTKVLRGTKGGRADQWSARKAQLAVHDYKKKGGGYVGPRSSANHLAQWTEEDWGTKSGRRSRDTGERYLPKKARRALSETEYTRTTSKKRADTEKGRQVSRQPQEIARKTASYRHSASSRSKGSTRAELYAEAKQRDVPGRSRMTKAQLQSALKRKQRR